MSWQTGGMIVGALAVVYGLLVSFAAPRLDKGAKNALVNGGAIALLLLAVFLFLLPLLGVY